MTTKPDNKEEIDALRKEISPEAAKAKSLTEQLPDDVRDAVEAMQRTTRIRRVYSSAEPDEIYYQLT